MEYKNNRQRTAAHPSGPRKKYKKRRKNKYHRRLSFLKAGIIILLLCIGVVLFFILRPHGDSRWKVEASEYDDHRPALDVQLLTPNEYSRPQTPLTSVNGIVIHYTANPGTDAQNNRDYFEGLKGQSPDLCQQPFCSRSGRTDYSVYSDFGDMLCVKQPEFRYCSH